MENKIFGYHIGDSRKIKEIISEKIVDVIITSPPYWNLKNYGVDNQIGFGQKYEIYLTELIEILDNCKDILKDKGSMWIIVDSFKKSGNIRLLPFEIADELQKSGWHLQDIIIWQKDKTLPWSSKGKLRNIFEYILFFTKSNKFNFYIDELREVELKKWWPKYPERYNPKGKVPSRVWEIPIPVQGWGKSWVKHFCPFPPRLVENILLLTTKENDVVLDPFAGSGSVLAQATVMNRKPIGFDLNFEYREMYYKKVLPNFKELWNIRKKELENINKKRMYLKKTIPSLRKIKYPIQFYKELLKIEPKIAESVKAIIFHNNKENPINYLLITNTKSHISKELISKIMDLKVMKKFSISPYIETKEIEELNKVDLDKKYYVYERGNNNYYSRKIVLYEFIKQLKDYKEKLPPVICNIKINQKDHHID